MGHMVCIFLQEQGLSGPSSRRCAGFPPGILGPNHRRWAVLYWAWYSTKDNLPVNHIIIMVLGHLVTLGIRIR